MFREINISIVTDQLIQVNPKQHTDSISIELLCQDVMHDARSQYIQGHCFKLYFPWSIGSLYASAVPKDVARDWIFCCFSYLRQRIRCHIHHVYVYIRCSKMYIGTPDLDNTRQNGSTQRSTKHIEPLPKKIETRIKTERNNAIRSKAT